MKRQQKRFQDVAMGCVFFVSEKPDAQVYVKINERQARGGNNQIVEVLEDTIVYVSGVRVRLWR